MLRIYARILFVFCCFIAATLSPEAHTQPQRVEAVTTGLIPSHTVISPNQPFQVHWLLHMDDGWHVYWQNGGDTGLAPTLDWALPEGFSATPLTWPVPTAIPTPPVMSYGYEHPVHLTATLTPPSNLPLGQPLTLQAQAGFLMCKDICLPGHATLTTKLSTGASPQANPAAAKLPAQAYPQPLPAAATLTANETHYQFTLPAGLNVQRFLPTQDGWIDDLATPARTATTLTVTKDNWSNQTPTHLSGLLWVDDHTAYTVTNLPVGGPLVPAPAVGPQLTLWLALASALLAGLILNLMPCVLPVLALKALSLIKQAHGRTWPLALAYTSGTLASFWLLGGTLLLLRGAGQQVGWGFHLQSPVFASLLTAAMALVTLSFYDYLKLPVLFGKAEHTWAQKATLKGAFFSGALVTLVATPCTVPFMGAATAYAITTGPAAMLATFTAMGLGLALPFLALCLFPPLTRWLPKPGPWMNTLRHLLGLPVLGATFWLLWLLTRLSVLPPVVAELIGCALAILLARACLKHLRNRHWRGISLILLGAMVWTFSTVLQPAEKTATSLNWQPWSTSAVATALAADQPVLIDVTADWCLTCKITERTTFRSAAFKELVSKKNIALFRADWTREDPAITALLNSYNRQGVPLYLLLSPATAPQVLPQLPTLEDFRTALKANQ